jgi:hypothetical protein
MILLQRITNNGTYADAVKEGMLALLSKGFVLHETA